MSAGGLTQLAFRTQKATGITEGYPEYEALPGFVRPEGVVRCFSYSPDGRFFAYAAIEGVHIVSSDSGAIVQTLGAQNVHELGFSPRGSFIITWQRPSKLEDGNAAKNMKVWRTDTAESVVAFVQKNQTGWNLQYTFDEKYCARVVTNEIQFYESSNMREVWQHLHVEGVSDFKLSPGANHHIAVFVPEKKGMPAKVQVYAIPDFDKPLSQKSFFKADKIEFNWNKAGTAVLFLTQTEVDKTGKSYYGETNLYLMNVKLKSDSRVTLDREGPIHDVTWSPLSNEFGVVYGYMPAKTTLFDLNGNTILDLPQGPRNTILFSPQGRLVLVAGFGNLQGQMDIIDREKAASKICTIEASNASVCEWSPDGKHILTATTSPRLRVDNGFKIWYAPTGNLMYNEEMTELYEVTWRPQDASLYPIASTLPPAPAPHSSAANHKSATPAKPAGAYRPPHARGSATPLHFKREDEGGAVHIAGSSGLFGGNADPGNSLSNGFGKGRRREVPGATPAAEKSVPGAAPGGGVSLDAEVDDSQLSKSALKNKKKREAAKKAKEAQLANGGIEGQTDGPDNENRRLQTPDRRQRDRSRSRENRTRNGSTNNFHTREGSFGNSNSRHQSPRPGFRNNGEPASAAPPGFEGVSRQRSQRNNRRGGPEGANTKAAATLPVSPPPVAEKMSLQTLNIPMPPMPMLEISSPSTPGGGGPEEKKQRSLLKKLRAIEDLKMRLAGGEKLEDTQMKKIGTEDGVKKDLEVLGWKG